ncbi:MAG: homoserine dehydrogenase, partial [Microbacteriaceae bacterium]|nr:homoserine dehydrogenase [Microbacteriaceae bacterium]
MIEYRNLRVALLGAGSVGAQVASLLMEHGAELA